MIVHLSFHWPISGWTQTNCAQRKCQHIFKLLCGEMNAEILNSSRYYLDEAGLSEEIYQELLRRATSTRIEKYDETSLCCLPLHLTKQIGKKPPRIFSCLALALPKKTSGIIFGGEETLISHYWRADWRNYFSIGLDPLDIFNQLKHNLKLTAFRPSGNRYFNAKARWL